MAAVLFNSSMTTNHLTNHTKMCLSWLVKTWLFAAVCIVVLAAVEQEPCVSLIIPGTSWRNRWDIQPLSSRHLPCFNSKDPSCIVLMCVPVFRWSLRISTSTTWFKTWEPRGPRWFKQRFLLFCFFEQSVTCNQFAASRSSFQAILHFSCFPLSKMSCTLYCTSCLCHLTELVFVV